jgi:hypothetical protein
MTDEISFQEVLDISRKNGRVCPQPRKWVDFTQLIWQRGDNEKIAAPLILAAWWDTPVLSKILRVEEQLRYAERHNRLQIAKQYL